jgi:RNA polymerase sigma-70 factor, ECF subfamily
MRRTGEASSSLAELRKLADEDLMPLVRREDATAFEVVYERHSGVAFSLAYRMCGQLGLAEDVTQEAFISLWRSGARYERGRGSVRTWILTIVHNRAVDALRSGAAQRGRQQDSSAAQELEAPGRTEVEVAQRDEAREIRGALEDLPPDQGRVIELAYFGGFTHAEIAEMLDAPIGTVKGRMRLGLAKLRVTLEQAGAAP